jgi:hypothetical protein
LANTTPEHARVLPLARLFLWSRAAVLHVRRQQRVFCGRLQIGADWPASAAWRSLDFGSNSWHGASRGHHGSTGVSDLLAVLQRSLLPWCVQFVRLAAVGGPVRLLVHVRRRASSGDIPTCPGQCAPRVLCSVAQITDVPSMQATMRYNDFQVLGIAVFQFVWLLFSCVGLVSLLCDLRTIRCLGATAHHRTLDVRRSQPALTWKTLMVSLGLFPFVIR